LALKNQPRGGFPGAEEVIREVCTVSRDLKIRAFSRRTAIGTPEPAEDGENWDICDFDAGSPQGGGPGADDLGDAAFVPSSGHGET
jgi:hypothetical protein